MHHWEHINMWKHLYWFLTLYSSASSGTLSMSTLARWNLSFLAAAIASSLGPKILQGPHHLFKIEIQNDVLYHSHVSIADVIYTCTSAIRERTLLCMKVHNDWHRRADHSLLEIFRVLDVKRLPAHWSSRWNGPSENIADLCDQIKFSNTLHFSTSNDVVLVLSLCNIANKTAWARPHMTHCRIIASTAYILQL